MDHLGQHIEQWTVIGRLRQTARRNQLLVGAHLAAGTGTGQHGLGLGRQPPSFCLVTLVSRFLSLHDSDRCRDDREDGQNNEPSDGRTTQASEAALLAHVIAGQFILGFAVNRGGQVGHLVAERQCL